MTLGRVIGTGTCVASLLAVIRMLGAWFSPALNTPPKGQTEMQQFKVRVRYERVPSRLRMAVLAALVAATVFIWLSPLTAAGVARSGLRLLFDLGSALAEFLVNVVG